MITLTIANQKGGVGKTTTAVTLAHGLALRGYSTLLIDLDPQGHCASHLGLEQAPGVFNLLLGTETLRDTVRSTGRPNLWLLPGNKRTATVEHVLAMEQANIDILSTILDRDINGHKLTYCVIDTAPSVGGLQEYALYAADLLLIPASVDHLGLKGVGEVLSTMRAVGGPTGYWILPTFYDEVTTESSTNLAELKRAFPNNTLDPIHRAVRLRECPSYGQTIWERAPQSRAAEEYAALVLEVLDATE